MVFNATKGRRERLGRLVQMHANRREEIQAVSAGQIVAAVGLKETTTGDTICGSRGDAVVLESITFPDPVVSVAIEPRSRADQDKLAESLVSMADEDPTFKVAYDGETGQTVISGMGELHLDVIVNRIQREYNVEGNVGRPKVAYRETITSPASAEGRFVRQTGGHGQYGHVWIEAEPLERGSGIQFENRIRGGAIPNEFIPSVGERSARGAHDRPAVGVPGRRYEGDAGGRQLPRSGLVEHQLPDSGIDSGQVGGLPRQTGDAGARDETGGSDAGRVLGGPPGRPGTETLGDSEHRGTGEIQSVRAEIPLAESFGYANAIRSLSQGRASYTMEFDNYIEVRKELVNSA